MALPALTWLKVSHSVSTENGEQFQGLVVNKVGTQIVDSSDSFVQVFDVSDMVRPCSASQNLFLTYPDCIQSHLEVV